MLNELLTTKELSQMIKKDRHYIQEIREAGLITGIRLGRGWLYPVDEINRFIEIAKTYDLSTKEGLLLASHELRKKALLSDKSA